MVQGTKNSPAACTQTCGQHFPAPRSLFKTYFLHLLKVPSKMEDYILANMFLPVFWVFQMVLEGDSDIVRQSSNQDSKHPEGLATWGSFWQRSSLPKEQSSEDVHPGMCAGCWLRTTHRVTKSNDILQPCMAGSQGRCASKLQLPHQEPCDLRNV